MGFSLGVFIGAAVCGVVVGVLSGLLGVGGGTIMVPIFRLIFGLSALASTGTSLFTMIFTSAAGSITHVRNKTAILPLGLLAGVCGALTSPLGVRLANASPAWLVMLATAFVIAYSASTMLRKGLAMPKAGKTTGQAPESEVQLGHAAPGDQKTAQKGDGQVVREGAVRTESSAEGASAHTEEAKTSRPSLFCAAGLSRRQYLIGALAGIAAGLAGGYVGLGGGFLMVPIFISFVGISMKQASGTSLLAVSILAAAGSIAQASFGNVELLAGLAMAIGSIPGAVVGANLTKRVPERNLRILFGVFLLIVSAILAINEFMF